MSAVHLAYALTALSRISAGRSGEVGYSRRVHDVIPGSTVRGALAAVWRGGDRPSGAGPAEFLDVFESRLLVRQAVPEGMVLEAVSARRCKYPARGCSSGWHDLAAGGVTERECPTCGGALEPGRGWAWTGQARTVATTRTALESNETASGSQLFSRRALRTRTVLRGSLVLLDGAASPEVLAWLTQPREIRVGGQRSHLGRARWTCQEVAAPAAPDLTGRVVLRAVSPLILVDELGAPTMDPTAALRRRWPGAVVGRPAWTRPVRVTGWHAASGLPKPEDWACEAGSTFAVEGLPAGAGAGLLLGLGLRRLEGFGEVEVLQPESLPRFTDSARGTTGVAEAPTTTAPPPPAVQSPEEVADPLDALLAVLPPGEVDGLLPKVWGGVRSVILGRGVAAEVAKRRATVLALPWARDLGGEARDRLRALLESDDLDRVKRRLDALTARDA